MCVYIYTVYCIYILNCVYFTDDAQTICFSLYCLQLGKYAVAILLYFNTVFAATNVQNNQGVVALNDLITKTSELKDDLEKKIFTSMGSIIQANSELQHSLETSMVICEDKISSLLVTNQEILATNKVLSELTDMRTTYNSITDGLIARMVDNLIMQLQEKFKLLFASFKDVYDLKLDAEIKLESI